jgi:hypothetical protein
LFLIADIFIELDVGQIQIELSIMSITSLLSQDCSLLVRLTMP